MLLNERFGGKTGVLPDQHGWAQVSEPVKFGGQDCRCENGRNVPQLILASQSPRRRELLTIAGFEFSVRYRSVLEVRMEGEPPESYVSRLAREKAEAAWIDGADEIVLGADTVVVVDDRVLEKPVDAEDARAMLRLLSGRTHVVMTGICLRHAAGMIVDCASTSVHFVPLEEREIDEYVASGEPMDKAGAYAIQGLASKFVDSVEGCYFNVMGLPLALVYRHLKRFKGVT
jgi:septum formation protein